MMARWLFVCAALAALAHAGCCCCGPCGGYQTAGCLDGPCQADCCATGACHQPCQTPCNGGCGLFTHGGCCLCIPKPIVWCGYENECGPHGCDSCACPSDCGLFSFCHWNKTCGKGCGEVYWGEWVSDPPDCCDPCDQCFGQWTGPHGYCQLGPLQHLLAALHGYKYCPRPCCGEWCGGCCGRRGGAGCAACGGGEHLMQGSVMPATPGEVYYDNAPYGQSIMTENWDRTPSPKPIPGKPIHKAEQPSPIRVGQAKPMSPSAAKPAMQPMNNRMVRTTGEQTR